MAASYPMLPLKGDPASRFLPWIVALKVYLAALALAGALALNGAVAEWQGARAGTITVQVPPPGADDDTDHVGAAVAVLRATPGVATARALERAEIVALLEPWLGAGNVDVGLPLPWLIDVTLDGETPLDTAALDARLKAAAPGAEIDDHGEWLARVTSAARAVQLAALAVVLAIFAATIGTVVFTTRTSLALHHDTVEVLHLIGAQDGFIARAFARLALRLGLKGGLIGLALAALTLAAVGTFSSGLEAPLLPRLSLTPAAYLALALLPVASALIAMATARVTVLRTLAAMP